MEDSTLDNDFKTDTEIRLDDNSRAYLKETAKWAKFLAIVGFIMSGLMILGGLFVGTIFSSLSSEVEEFSAFPMWIMSVFYILFALLYLMPTLYLYRFATKMTVALERDDQFELSSSFESLKSLFKFVGIFTVTMLVLYGVLLLGGVLVGALAS